VGVVLDRLRPVVLVARGKVCAVSWSAVMNFCIVFEVLIDLWRCLVGCMGSSSKRKSESWC
jgi:hypothetical protein